MMKRDWRPRKLGLLLGPAFVLLAACQPDRPPPSGNLLRPAGLLVVDRRTATTAPQRADVFIADSAAQGIRVLQLLRDPRQTTIDDQWFVVSPAAFFPLVIPADGYPTRLAISASKDRLFALSPASGVLHMLGVEETAFKGSSLDPSNVPLAQVRLQPVLDQIGEATGTKPTGIPIALGMLPTPTTAYSLVAIAFDVLEGGPARVAAIRVPRNLRGTIRTGSISLDLNERGGRPGSVTIVATATVAQAPRDMVVRDDALLLSSSATSSVSVVYTSQQAGRRFTSSDTLDSGGPTSGMIDAKGAGVLALRLDRTSAVLFERNAATRRYSRSTAHIESPYTPYLERNGPGTQGRIDLLDSSIAITGTHGRFPTLIDQFDLATGEGLFDLLDDSDRKLGGGTGVCATAPCADIVILAHINGRSSFLIGSPPRPAICSARPDQLGNLRCVKRVTTTTQSVARVVSLEGDVLIDECAPFTPQVCNAASASATRTRCDGISVTATLAATAQTLRATFLGTLAGTRAAVISRTGTIAVMLPDMTTATQVRFQLTDSTLSFPSRQVRAGDRAVVQMVLPPSCSSLGVAFQIAGLGTVAAVAEQSLELRFATSSALEEAWRCPDGLSLVVASYEVFPENDVVLAAVRGTSVEAVLARTAPVDSDQKLRAHFDSPVRLTLSAPSLSCRAEVGSGASCTLDAECPSGGKCAALAPGCLGRCTTSCPLISPFCLSAEITRRCSGVELGIAPLPRFTTAATLGFSSRDTTFLPAVPDYSILVPMRQSFMTSYPGSRAIVETKIDPINGPAVGVIR